MNMISKKGNIIFPFLAELKPNIQTYRSKYAAEFIWLAVGQFLTLLLSFISIKYLTSIGPKDYGLFVLLTSLTSLASSIYFNPFEQSYVRYLFENSSADDQQKMFLRKFLSGIARSVGLTFMLFLCIAAFSHFSSIGKNYVSVAAIVVIVLPLANQPITGMLNALRLRKTVAMIQVTEKAIQVMLFIFISKFVTLTLSLVFQTIGLVFLTSLLLRLYFIRKYCVGIQTPHNARSQLLAPTLPQQLFHFMLPFIIWGIFGGLQMNGERWIVESIMTTSEVGRYGLAFSLISSTAVVSNTIVSQFFLPFIYKAFSSKEESRQQEGKKLIAIYRWSIIVIFVGFACLFGFLGDDVIRLVSTKDFSVGGMFMFMLTLGIGFYYIAQVETTIGLSLCKTNIYLVPKIIASLSSILLYFLGCSFGKLNGIALAVLCVNVGYLYWITVVNKKLLAEHHELSRNEIVSNESPLIM